MHEKLQDKSKVDISRPTKKVAHDEKAVTVICEDGTTVRGDIVVGCDGVHSTTHQGTWRLAHVHEQTTFDPSAQDLLLVVGGGKGRMYWFVFKRLDRIGRGRSIFERDQHWLC